MTHITQYNTNDSESKKPKTAKFSIKQRRQQVLTVLAEMLHSEQGMQRITTAQLAAAVGVSEAALYRYFPSKTKIFEALLDALENNLVVRINNIIKNETNTKNRIHNIMQMILDFSKENPGFTRILTGHALMFEAPELQAKVSTFFDRLELQFTNILQMRKLREAKSFSVNERVIAAHLVILCEGQFMRYVRSNFSSMPDQGFDQQWRFIETLFN